MLIEIGKNVQQKEGFEAFVPESFPPRGIFHLSPGVLLKLAEADRLIGKLDGVTHTLPDVDFFLRMFVAKEAATSAQIEGTRATLIDAIRKDIGVPTKATDAEDILFYIRALNYGTKRLQRFPLSLRLIREIHEKLMTGARAAHFSDPGEFRETQNWIGGSSPGNAFFVPPPAHEMHRALHDFELFLHEEKDILPLVHIALAHAQFETIHPFLDGNGRTGRLLITLLLCHRGLLERPVLFLSTFFRRHQKAYYSRLNSYYEGDVSGWIEFFLDGVLQTARDSIEISKAIRKIRDEDMTKIQGLAKRESESGILVLSHLFGNPIVTSKSIMKWTGFTRAGAHKVLERFTRLEILKPRGQKGIYDLAYEYDRYLRVFVREQ